MDFSDGSVGKESTCSAGDTGSIPVLGRFPGEGNGNPFQYSCLGSPMNRRACMAINHGVSRVGNNIVTKPLPLLATNKLPRWHSGKESACQCRRHKRQWFDPWIRKIPGVGKGNTLHYSSLQNSMDWGSWRTTVHGVSKSQIQLSTQHSLINHIKFRLCFVNVDIYYSLLKNVFPVTQSNENSSREIFNKNWIFKLWLKIIRNLKGYE